MAEVLILGSGGREQAIKQAMNLSGEVSRVEVSADPREGLELFAGGEKPFVIVGPEALIVAGIADELRDEGYSVLAPSKKASIYEASKSRAVKMMRSARVPHPDTFISSTTEGSLVYVETHDPVQYVIKGDGLAGGKAVILPKSRAEALQVTKEMREGSYSGSGREILNFQDRHTGPEVSAMVLVGKDETDIVILPLSQDHKPLLRGDQGPNTGGMGAYAPVPESIVDNAQHNRIRQIAQESIKGMRGEGVKYEKAVLYIGLMMSRGLAGSIHKDRRPKPKVLEYNVRFGDPEIQAILPILLRGGVDVYRLLRSTAEGQIEHPSVDFANIGSAALSVCLAAKDYGYPDRKARSNDVVYGLDQKYEGVSVQLAAVKQDGPQPVTGGGRELYVTGVGVTVDEAAARAYSAIGENAIHFDGMQYRDDIGHQARTAA